MKREHAGTAMRVTLSIQPEGAGAPFEGIRTMVVSHLDIPRPGDRYPVWYDPEDPSRFGIGTDVEASAPADVRRCSSGRLTDEEFNRAKDRLLAGSPPGSDDG